MFWCSEGQSSQGLRDGRVPSCLSFVQEDHLYFEGDHCAGVKKDGKVESSTTYFFIIMKTNTPEIDPFNNVMIK